ncbi:hypothetical protein N657DRAFT_701485, partial [Parathielavia appendiculata]
MALNSLTIGASTAGISRSDPPMAGCHLPRAQARHPLPEDRQSLCKANMKEDWLKEALSMQNVYGCVAFNVVAGRSSSPHDSIFHTRDAFPALSAIV